MSLQHLVEDGEGILSSPRIQITHKHPANSHRVRSDLDLEDLVVESYPLKLADKIIPFLDQVPLRWHSVRGHSSSSFCTPAQTPQKRKRIGSFAENDVAVSQISQVSTTPHPNNSTLPIMKSRFLSLPKPLAIISTPQREVLSPLSASKPSTPRTVSPGGTLFSPQAKHHNTTTPLRSRSAPRISISSRRIPSTFFSPPHPQPTYQTHPHESPATQGRGRSRGRGRNHRGTARGRGSRTSTVASPVTNPTTARQPLVQFEPSPRSIEYSWSKPTLVLRHDVSTQALRDMFTWSWRCVAEGKIVGLEETGMILFHDVTRVLEIREVCMLFKMMRLATACEMLLNRWDGSEPENIGNNGNRGCEDDVGISGGEDASMEIPNQAPVYITADSKCFGFHKMSTRATTDDVCQRTLVRDIRLMSMESSPSKRAKKEC